MNSVIEKVDKKKVADSFLKGSKTYDEHARVQKNVSKLLIDKLKKYDEISYGRVLEIGCCTGNLTELLVNSFPVGNLYLNDIVEEFYMAVIERIKNTPSMTIHPCFGDIEKIDIPQNLGVVVSSGTFQWLQNIRSVFKKIASSLNREGWFGFSIFGPGTFREMREITGVGLEYLPVGTILDMLECDFHIEEEQTVKDQLFFTRPYDVLRHVQSTGVSGIKKHRWTKQSLYQFEKDYLDKFGSASGVPVTYMSSYIIASKKG